MDKASFRDEIALLAQVSQMCDKKQEAWGSRTIGESDRNDNAWSGISTAVCIALSIDAKLWLFRPREWLNCMSFVKPPRSEMRTIEKINTWKDGTISN
jgi:hypothetical protein